MILRSLVIVATLTLVARIAAAAPESRAVAEARVRYERGRELYQAGRFKEAIAEWQAGFDLVPRPLFLLNLGQAQRQLGELRAARRSYQRFLDASPPNDPDRPEVVDFCRQLDDEIARLPPEAPSAPVVAPVRPPAEAAPAPPPPRKPFIRRHWWIIPVSVVAATGLSLGLYFGLRDRDDDCARYSYGCATLGK